MVYQEPAFLRCKRVCTPPSYPDGDATPRSIHMFYTAHMCTQEQTHMDTQTQCSLPSFPSPCVPTGRAVPCASPKAPSGVEAGKQGGGSSGLALTCLLLGPSLLWVLPQVPCPSLQWALCELGPSQGTERKVIARQESLATSGWLYQDHPRVPSLGEGKLRVAPSSPTVCKQAWPSHRHEGTKLPEVPGAQHGTTGHPTQWPRTHSGILSTPPPCPTLYSGYSFPILRPEVTVPAQPGQTRSPAPTLPSSSLSSHFAASAGH